MGEFITINGPDGAFRAYRAAPEGDGPVPGLVVIQEIFGVNKVMRDLCDDYARQGFLAVCPDLFWRIEPGVDITDQSEAEWAKAFDLFGKFKADTGIKDIAATLDHVREDKRCTGKAGAVGYCLGGLLAFLTACRTDAEACVGYYGVAIPNYLKEASGITGHLMLHVAGRDQYVDADAQAAMHAALDGHPLVTLHDYPDQDHAFARPGGKHYHAGAAREANALTIAFLKTHLA